MLIDRMQIAHATLADDDLEPGSSSGGVIEPTLLFFHIGRTGGTSLTRYFSSLARQFFVQPVPDQDLPLEASSDSRYPDFISGHYPVDPWLRRLPASWRTMMVIRDPIQHLLSSYWHIRTHPDVSDNPGLRLLIEDTRRDDLDTLLRHRAGESFEAHFDNPQTRFILNKQTGQLCADDLTRATALLESLSYVGITERLGEFAAQVAASLPWAAAWRQKDLPRMMVNPLNTQGAGEIPRTLLRRILAATELDAELHRRARQLQSERQSRDVGLPGMLLNLQASPTSPARAIPIVDLIRVSATKVHGCRQGHEFYIDGDEIILHPPERTKGYAAIVIEDISLDLCSEVWGRLALAHEGASPVIFGIEIRQSATVIMSATFTVAPAHPIEIRLRFPPATGSARLELRTEMALRDSNHFAWATFTGLTMG